MIDNPLCVALLWYGTTEARKSVTFEGSHFKPLADELGALGVDVVPVVYNVECAYKVRAQLASVDGVLVWVNPIEAGHDRSVLNSLLLELSEAGVFVSAHPDVIQKLGTKEVLYSTRAMSWGTETHCYSTYPEFREQLPLRLDEGQPRVLKQYRGNGGNGVWKVEPHPGDPKLIRVWHALRGSVQQDMTIEAFIAQCEQYFSGNGKIIDQPYQDRLVEGMVRCYMVGDKVAGFGHQSINALFPACGFCNSHLAPTRKPMISSLSTSRKIVLSTLAHTTMTQPLAGSRQRTKATPRARWKRSRKSVIMC